MATRVVEGKKPYTGGKAISIDENKVISLNLRDENNLIIYDEGDDEIYVDLQLDDEITPTSAFPIGVNVGRVIVDNGWDKPGTIISAETTSGDNIKIFYADEGTLWIDNGTGTFKQIYFKADVDALLLALRNYIDGELAKKQNGVSSDTAPSNPSEGDLWYDTTNSAMKVWDGTAWQSVGTGGGGSDIVYATQAEYNALLPGAESDGKHYFIYSKSGGGGWQPNANTLLYLPLESDFVDMSGQGTTRTFITSGLSYTTVGGVPSMHVGSTGGALLTSPYPLVTTATTEQTVSVLIYVTTQQSSSRRNVFEFRVQDNISCSIMLVENTSNIMVAGDLATITAPITANSWMHIVLTNSSAGINLYKDGVLVSSGAGSATPRGNRPRSHENNQTLFNARDGLSASQALNGNARELIMENRVWTAQEVADYYTWITGQLGIS